jgi:hypothetical protein
MSLETDTYNENVKKKFIDGYHKYLEANDVSELVFNTIIPNFEILACDLEELIDKINESSDNKNQVIDYIELIFNSKLYDSILEVLKTQSDIRESFTHYLIILIEFVKWEKYQKIKTNLSNYEGLDKKVIIFDVLNQATDERSNYCLEKIRSTYNDLVTNYSQFTNCIDACENLLESNNLKFF